MVRNGAHLTYTFVSTILPGFSKLNVPELNMYSLLSIESSVVGVKSDETKLGLSCASLWLGCVHISLYHDQMHQHENLARSHGHQEDLESGRDRRRPAGENPLCNNGSEFGSVDGAPTLTSLPTSWTQAEPCAEPRCAIPYNTVSVVRKVRSSRKAASRTSSAALMTLRLLIESSKIGSVVGAEPDIVARNNSAQRYLGNRKNSVSLPTLMESQLCAADMRRESVVTRPSAVSTSLMLPTSFSLKAPNSEMVPETIKVWVDRLYILRSVAGLR